MISSFEYVTVLISIILGLGITQILTGIADLFHKSEKVRLYWPHVLWILFVLILHVQEWWVTYELKSYQPWRLPTFLFIMLYPINLFVLARMLFPTKLKGKCIDLRDFYFKNYRRIFLLLIVSAILSILHNVFILKLTPSSQVLQLLLVATFSFIAIKNFTNEWMHKSLAVIVIIFLMASIAVEWNIWLIN